MASSSSKRPTAVGPPEAVKRPRVSEVSQEGIRIGEVVVEVEGAFPDISTREVLSAFAADGLPVASGADGVLRAAPSPVRGSHGGPGVQFTAGEFGDAVDCDTLADLYAKVLDDGKDSEDFASGFSDTELVALGLHDGEPDEVAAAIAAVDPTTAAALLANAANGPAVAADLAFDAAAFAAVELDADVMFPDVVGVEDSEPAFPDDAGVDADDLLTLDADALGGVLDDEDLEDDGDPLSSGRRFEAFQLAFQRAFSATIEGEPSLEREATADTFAEEPPEDPISEVLPYENPEDAIGEAGSGGPGGLTDGAGSAAGEDGVDDDDAMPPPMCDPRGKRVRFVEDADYPLCNRSKEPGQALVENSTLVAEGSCPFLDEDEEAEAEGRLVRRDADGADLPPMPPPTTSPPPSPPSPPPTPMQGKFLIREGSDRGDVLKFFVSGSSFASTYEVGRKIGEGGFGKVFVAKHRVLGLERAVKRLRKARGRANSHMNELQALLALDHPHIVKLVEYYDEEHYLYLIFELCDGPDLFDRVTNEEKGRLSEVDASLALRHILKAIQCCHSKYRGHFDIKPENFMYATKELGNLKMIDLGMSSGFDLHRRRHKIKGTAAYMAPELWRGTYGPEADIWSVGVVLFVMLTGEPALPNLAPATMKNESKICDLIRRRMKYAVSTFGLSTEAQDLLTLMLQHDRHGRPTVREALKHPFCNLSYDSEVNMPHRRKEEATFNDASALLNRLPETLRAVAEEPMLKRVARLAMAHIGDATRAEDLAFRMLDWHGYGELSVSVLEKDLKNRVAEMPDDLDRLFESIDLLREGYISYLTFLSVTLPVECRRDENLCNTAFRILDRDHDGSISVSDLVSVFGNEEVCRGILQEVSSEERLNLDAFLQMMREDIRMSEHPFCWTG